MPVRHSVLALYGEIGEQLTALNAPGGPDDAAADKARRVVGKSIPLLLCGESGVGKELFAQAVHDSSPRRHRPLVAINCAAIPEHLIEAELFGYSPGAFTGARKEGSPGRIREADGGTLFLDEIGDMPLLMQTRLLRVLQERQVTPLGSTKSVAVDVSIICATHRNLRQMIDTKVFREDLFYRLNGLAVRLPPLRERSDLMPLVRRILDRQLADELRPQRRLELTAEVVRLFEGYQWPGNVRQLFNVLRTAAVMAAGESVITREHLSDDFLDEAQGQAGTAPVPRQYSAAGSAGEPAAPVPAAPAAAAAMPAPRLPAEPAPERHAAGSDSRSLEEQEIDAIRRALDAAGGNISEASKRLGISRNTIYRKLRWNKTPG